MDGNEIVDMPKTLSSTELGSMLRTLDSTYRDAQQDLTAAQELQRSVESSEDLLRNLQRKIEDNAIILEYLLTAEDTLNEQVTNYFETVANQALRIVFPNPYRVIIKFEMKRNQQEATIVLSRDGIEFSPDEVEGGVLDVLSFAFRLSLVSIRSPSIRKVLILDEPFRFVSKGFRPAVREMLDTLSERCKVQIIMVTHLDELITDDAINL